MPLGGYSYTEKDDKVLVHADGKAHGYSVPSKAQITDALLQVKENQVKAGKVQEIVDLENSITMRRMLDFYDGNEELVDGVPFIKHVKALIADRRSELAQLNQK